MTLDAKGDIVVDEYQNAVIAEEFKNKLVPKIYALGDVCGKALLTPGELLLVCLRG